MQVKGKEILILGGGRSGLSAAKFLLARGAVVTLYDDLELTSPAHQELAGRGVCFCWGRLPAMARFQLCVISPGIILSHPAAVAVKEAGVPLIGEIELAARFIKGPIIGITGTNGKTTTTTLVGELLKNAGYQPFIGGNIGLPLLEAVDGDYDYYVVEMSSFQLETIDKLNVKIALILNVTPDHLDRHGTMENYVAAKANLVTRQSKENYAVLNYDDPYLQCLAGKTGGRLVWFSRLESLYEGTCLLHEQQIVYRQFGSLNDREAHIMNIDDIRLPGPHNLENALGAITVAKLLGISNGVIKKTLKSFRGVEHRQEEVRTLRGVLFVNDSKATNPDAAIKALQSYEGRAIVLIAGGRNKGVDFTDLAAYIKDYVRYLVLIGEAAPAIAEAVRKVGFTSYCVADDMEQAVMAAYRHACEGDVVLLSPANTSFDWYKDYEERGKVFKDIVLKLKRGKPDGRHSHEEKAT